jgi:hypothetical protein
MRGTVLSERVRETQGERPSPSVWLNLVCLDAPLVAIVWQALFARTFGTPLTLVARAALFLTAWLIYLTDRLVDTSSLNAGTPRSVRQEFCLRRRRTWLVVIAAVGMADCFAVAQLRPQTVVAGLGVALIAGVYLCANLLTRLWRILPVKELAIGWLFAVATALVPVLYGRPRMTDVAMSIAAFATVCMLNCICIAAWERELDRAQKKETLATVWPQIDSAIVALCIATSAVCFIVALFASNLQALLICVAASASFLALLHLLRGRIQSDSRTALADVVLLTPLLSLALTNR